MSINVRICVFLVLSGICRLSIAESNLEDLLSRAAAVPASIKSGDWVLKTQHRNFGEKRRSYDASFHIEFDGEKIRVQREVEGRVTVYCSPYLNATQSFFFASSPQSVLPQSDIPDHLNIPKAIPESLILYQKKDFDGLRDTVGISVDASIPCIRTMGYVTDDVYFQARHFVNLSTYFRRFEKGDNFPAVIHQENFKGVPCTLVRKTVDGPIKRFRGEIHIVDKAGNPVQLPQQEIDNLLKKTSIHTMHEIILDPSKNDAIRRMVSEDSFIKSRMVLENDMKQDETSGVWYPSHWTFEEYRDGKLVLREENNLEVISINKSINAKRFTLESVEGLKPGTPVIWKLDTLPPGKGKLEWDGKNFFAHGEFGEHKAMQDIDPIQRKRRWLFIASINVAIISGILSYHYYKSWRRHADGQ